VCEPICWNHSVGLCATCAPKMEGEIAHAKSEAQIYQIQQKAYTTDLAGNVDIKADHVVTCPNCGAQTQGGKFCAECGAALVQKKHCTECGTEMDASSKFCPNCGHKAG
jgi:rRNA maturation endonuclease Nob1